MPGCIIKLVDILDQCVGRIEEICPRLNVLMVIACMRPVHSLQH